jgi:hypothetical protein
MPSTETQAEAWVSVLVRSNPPLLQHSITPTRPHADTLPLLPPPVNTRSNKKDRTCENADRASRDTAILFDNRLDRQLTL